MHSPFAPRFLRVLATSVALGALPLAHAYAQTGTAKPSSTEAWRIIQLPQASEVFARDGSLIGEIGKELRVNVSIASLPKYVPQAFIAVEDQRFYQHDGVDLVGIAGAIKDNILGDRRGASTITQQLVGNMHPHLIDRTDMSLSRKLREQAAAREMERRYTKAQILEAYLNIIDFGHRYFGIEVAARHYFGKAASRLTIAEAATLASIPKGPAVYDPVRFPDRVRERRNVVLMLMAEQGYISKAQATEAQAAPLKLAPNRGMAAPAQYVVDVVRIQATRAGIPVTDGGYRIHTSIDPLLQRFAVEALDEEAQALEAGARYPHPKYPEKGYLQGAIVVMDPITGDIRALVGGRDYVRSPFNRAIDGLRQPGSAFKPIVYATAIADSLTPVTMVGDTAIAIRLPNGTMYRPQNSDHQFLGSITLRTALAKSRNVVAVELGQQLTMDSIIANARRMGIRTPIASVPASAIGASAVRPIDLVTAYTTFANMGTPVESRFIYRIEDRSGATVFAPPIRALPPVFDPRVVFVVRDMMRGVVEEGTATVVRRMMPAGIPVAGKTGTTDDNSDVWFVGMTPDLVAGVWLGFDTPKTITGGAAGGSLAAPVWARMMSKYYAQRGTQESAWKPPVGVIAAEFDRATGALATAATPPDRRYTEYFVEGTEPEALKLDPWTVFEAGALRF